MAQQPAKEWNGQESTEALLRAMSGRDVQQQQPIVERTRRAVRIADQSRREQGHRGRRTSGIALFALGAVFLVLGPVLWSGMDGLIAGEHFADMPTQLALLSAILLLAIVSALVAGWRTRCRREDMPADPRNLLR